MRLIDIIIFDVFFRPYFWLASLFVLVLEIGSAAFGRLGGFTVYVATDG